MDIFMRLDTSGRVLRFVAGAGYVGRPAAELVGCRIDELLPADEAVHIGRAIALVIATKEAQVVEHRRPSSLGERSARVRLTLAADGTIIAHILDVTEQVGTRDSLAETVESNRLFTKASTDAYFDYDVASDRVQWTENITSALGYPSGMVSDLIWWNDRIHPDDRAAVRAMGDDAMSDPGRAIMTTEYRFLAADGRWLDILNRSLFIRDAAGKPVRVVGSLIDVTERKRLEQRLRMADRLSALGTFAAGLGHEVKNPLSATIGNLALAKRALRTLSAELGTRGAGILSDVDAMILDAIEGARRVGAVVDGLAVFNHRGAAHVREVDLRLVVERALSIAGHDLTRRARVDLDLEAVPLVRGDPHQLGQVVLNLLANAQQSMDGDGAVQQSMRISLCERDRCVVLEVEDSGPGIKDEHMPRLFEPFFTTKPEGEGTGLGLAICKEVVVAHAGTIEAESVRPHGALFRVRLPVTIAT